MRLGLAASAIAFVLGTVFSAAVLAAGLVPQEIVSAHNRWRAEVGVAPLSYSSKLAVSAKAWAEKLKASEQCGLRHSGKPDTGENLYGATATGPISLVVTSAQVVDAWGEEKKDYDYASNSSKPGAVCGHYTQVVWRDTKSVGCGVAFCAAGDTKAQVWVCQYSPPGNYVGRRPY
jgi:pathogenesis-related protein 1